MLLKLTLDTIICLPYISTGEVAKTTCSLLVFIDKLTCANVLHFSLYHNILQSTSTREFMINEQGLIMNKIVYEIVYFRFWILICHIRNYSNLRPSTKRKHFLAFVYV